MNRQKEETGCIFCTRNISVYDCVNSSDTYFPCDVVSKIKIKCNKTHGIHKKDMRKRAQTYNNKMYCNTRAHNTPTFHMVKHIQIPELKKFASSSESSSDEDTENVLFQNLGRSKKITTNRSAYSNSDQLSSEEQSDTSKEDKQWLENLKNFRQYNWFDCHAEMRSLLGSTEQLQKLNGKNVQQTFSLSDQYHKLDNFISVNERVQKFLQASYERNKNLSASTENLHSMYRKSDHLYRKDHHPHKFTRDVSRTNVISREKSANRLRNSGSNSMALRHQMGISN